MKKTIFTLVFLTTYLSAMQLQYPELGVTPRASERIEIEAKNDNSIDYGLYAPTIGSTAMTLTTAMLTSQVYDSSKGGVGLHIGLSGAILGGLTYLMLKDKPYQDAIKKLSSHQPKNKRSLKENLIFERLADEEIARIRKRARLVRYITVGANVFINATLGELVNPDIFEKRFPEVTTQDDLDKKKLAENVKTLQSLSIAVSLLPLFFKSRAEEVYDSQEKYKKRIFSPVALAPVLISPTGTSASGLQASWRF